MILFCGDPHSYFAHLIPAVHGYRPEAVFSWVTYSRKGPWKSNQPPFCP